MNSQIKFLCLRFSRKFLFVWFFVCIHKVFDAIHSKLHIFSCKSFYLKGLETFFTLKCFFRGFQFVIIFT